MAIALSGTPASGDQASSTTWNVTRPTLSPKDVCLVALVFDNNNTPTITPPSGFVLLDSDGYSANAHIRVYRKVWTGLEASPLVFTFSVATMGSWATIAYSGVDNLIPEDVPTSSYNLATSTTTPTQAAQRTATNGAMLVGFWGQRDFTGTGTAGGSATERIEHPKGNMFMYVEDLEKTTTGSEALTFTGSAAQDIWQGIQVALRPTAPTGVAFKSSVGGNITSSTTLSVPTPPAGIVDGDFLLLWASTNSGTATLGAGGPSASGWTQIGSLQVHGTDNTMACWYKIASGEGSSYSFTNTYSGSQAISYIMAAYSGVDTNTPLDVAAVQENSGNTETAPSISITTVTRGAMVVFLLGSDPGVDPVAFAANTPSGSISRMVQQNALNNFVGAIDYLQAAPGAVTITGATSSDAYTETAIALRPAPNYGRSLVSGGIDGGTTASPTVTNSVAVGEKIVGTVASLEDRTLTVTDSGGNTYTVTKNRDATGETFYLFWADCTTALTSGVSTITFTFNTATSWAPYAADVLTNVASGAPADTKTNSGQVSTWSTANSTTTANSILYGGAAYRVGNSTSHTATNGTEVRELRTGNSNLVTMYRPIPVGGTHNISGNYNDGGGLTIASGHYLFAAPTSGTATSTTRDARITGYSTQTTFGVPIRGANQPTPMLANGPQAYDDVKVGPSFTMKVGPGDYRMWYEGIDNSLDPGGGNLYNAVCYATSADGKTWTKQGKILSPLAIATWENSEICPNAVVWNPDTSLYHLYYHGGNNSPSLNRRIGVATSPNITGGGSWTRYGSNPIITPGAGGSWDEGWMADSKVMRMGTNDWRMWYVGRNNSNLGQVGYATSTDGLSWTKYGSNPVLGFGAGGTWDDFDILAFCPVYVSAGNWHAWYVAQEQAGGNTQMGHLTSTDGINWTRDAANPVLSDVTDDDLSDSVDAYLDSPKKINIYYGQYDLVGQTLRGKGRATSYEVQSARGFSGTTQYVTLASESGIDFEKTNAFTLAAWINADTANSSGIVCKQSGSGGAPGYNLGLSANGGLAMDLRAPTGGGAFQRRETTTISTGTWYSAVGTYDGSNAVTGINLYRNGAPSTMETSDNNLTGSILNDVEMQIGARGGSGAPTFYFDGKVAYVAVWNVALTAAQVKEYHAGGALPRQDALVAFLRLDAGASPELDDKAAHNGTVTSATLEVGAPIGYDTLSSATQIAYPVADISDGSWLNESSNNTNLYASIDEVAANDADYIQSSLSPTSADIVKVRLGALTDPNVSNGHVVKWRYKKDSTGGDQINLTVKLLRADATTVIAQTTVTNIDAVTDGTLTLSGAEADSIPSADYATGLVLQFEAIKP